MKNSKSSILDERSIDWPDLWVRLLPYYAEDLANGVDIDSLDRYLIEAVEKDGDQTCMRKLLHLSTISLNRCVSQSGMFSRDAPNYAISLLEKIANGEEPNTVFNWTNPSRGPRAKSKHFALLNVAIPEVLRRNRKREIEDSLNDPKLSRRERKKLTEEYSYIKEPSHSKKSHNSETGSADDYSPTRVRQILEEHGLTAELIIKAKKTLEAKFQKRDRKLRKVTEIEK